jgi:hypothetical protein
MVDVLLAKVDRDFFGVCVCLCLMGFANDDGYSDYT